MMKESFPEQFCWRGGPQSPLLPMYITDGLSELRVSSWRPDGILPDKLLYDRFKASNDARPDKLDGISPESLFSERSRDTSDFMAPIKFGICPLYLLDDKFKFITAARDVMSVGISPVKELLDKSMLTRYTNVLLYTSCCPFRSEEHTSELQSR